MARKSRQSQEKPLRPPMPSVAEDFPASFAAAEFLSICSAGAQRGRRSKPSVPRKPKADPIQPQDSA
jgi:hypothetical protein